MDKEKLINKIKEIKKDLGKRIVIPAHHYQSPDIVQFGDFIGDSYKLAVECSKTDADYIVFCGVLFMAEGASILSRDNQKVLLPERSAGCPMADMAAIEFVEKAYEKIKKEVKRDIAPVVYMNSYADLKSFCGIHGGSVCTSSNADKIFEYYFKQDKAILFFPDYYLGRNTANTMGIDEKYIVKIKKDSSFKSTGDITEAKVLLWDGYCPIHQRFTVGDIKYLREKYPGIKIIVHPESAVEVVNEADMSGSTEKIFRLIKESPSGSKWGIGTESTFVNRLADDYPDKLIVPLRESKCKNMLKITLEALNNSLQSILDYQKGKGKLITEIRVAEEYKTGAKKALQKMIEIVEG